MVGGGAAGGGGGGVVGEGWGGAWSAYTNIIINIYNLYIYPGSVLSLYCGTRGEGPFRGTFQGEISPEWGREGTPLLVGGGISTGFKPPSQSPLPGSPASFRRGAPFFKGGLFLGDSLSAKANSNPA